MGAGIFVQGSGRVGHSLRTGDQPGSSSSVLDPRGIALNALTSSAHAGIYRLLLSKFQNFKKFHIISNL